MRETGGLLLFGLLHNSFVGGCIGKIFRIEVSGRTVYLSKFMRIYRLNRNFNYLYVLQQRMSQGMVKFIDVYYILKCCAGNKFIVTAQS